MRKEVQRKAYQKRIRKLFPVMFCVCALLLEGCAVQNKGQGDALSETLAKQEGSMITAAAGTVTTLDVSDLFTNRDREIGYDEEECVILSPQEGGITISEEGKYILRGEWSGSIVIDADKKDKVQLILDGVSVKSENGAALYVKQADKVFVTTAAGSENLFRSAGEFAEDKDNNVDGAVFSKDDLTFNGAGVLKVVCDKGHGIVCKDDLVITSGSYVITAGSHGIQGKDSVRILSGNIEIDAAQDGIHSGNDNDDSVGYTYIGGGNITVKAGDDGIHSDTQLVVAGGTVTVTESYEGLEGHTVEITDGVVTVNARDDGVNAAGGNDGSGSDEFGEWFMKGGAFDDSGRSDRAGKSGKSDGTERSGEAEKSDRSEIGERADKSGKIDGVGENDNDESNNKTERTDGKKTGGKLPNTRGGLNNVQQNPFEGFGKGAFDVDENAMIIISGGSVRINAEGDGVDSNGTLYVTGGEVIVNGPTNGGNGALDYGSDAAVTGGTLIALGASGMAENFGDNSTQPSIMVNIQGMQKAGTTAELRDSSGKVLLSCASEKEYNSVVFSCPELKVGETYTVVMGDQTTQVMLESMIYGKGMGGGFPGGFGGFGDFGDGGPFGKGQKPGGDMEPPQDGQWPTPPQDGQMPEPPQKDM